MYTFKKLHINNKTRLALVVKLPQKILINFSTFVYVKNILSNPGNLRFQPDIAVHLDDLKNRYREELLSMIVEKGYALVDISSGEIIDPSLLSDGNILEVFKGPLPF